jgi:hypothetical protein
MQELPYISLQISHIRDIGIYYGEKRPVTSDDLATWLGLNEVMGEDGDDDYDRSNTETGGDEVSSEAEINYHNRMIAHLDVHVLEQLLEVGHQPNASRDRHAVCQHSIWESFLRVWVIEPHLRYTEGKRLNTKQEDKIACIMLAMLESGANPNCAPCLDNDRIEHNCRRLALREVIESYIPERWQSELLTRLQSVCEEPARQYIFKRQKLRALRAFRSTPEALYPSLMSQPIYLTEIFTRLMTFLIPLACLCCSKAHQRVCSSCDSILDDALFTCLDCMDFPPLCEYCLDDATNPHVAHRLLILDWYDETKPADRKLERLTPSCLQDALSTLEIWYDENAETYGVYDQPPRYSV